jgi:hypothetical protein
MDEVVEVMDAFSEGHETGFCAAILLYGLHDCTVRNNGEEIMRLPLKDHSCYVELDPGEEAALRTVAA